MLRQEFLSFFKSFLHKEEFGRKPEPESPYTKTSKRLLEIIENYSGKRFAKKIFSGIPKEIFEKLDDEKIRKIEKKLTLEVEKALKRLKVADYANYYSAEEVIAGEIIGHLTFFYQIMLYREAKKDAVKEVFSEESLREIADS